MGFRAGRTYIDNDGAICVLLTNRTGAPSVQGAMVIADTANDHSVISPGANSEFILGTFRDAGIANGSDAWVQVAGITLDLFDAGGAVRGGWAGSSATAGASQSQAGSPGNVALHFQESGHPVQAAGGGGTARVVRHLN